MTLSGRRSFRSLIGVVGCSQQAFPILVPSRQYHEEGIFKKIALRKKVFKGAIFVMSDIIIISKAKKASKKDTAKWEYRARLSTATCIVKALASGTQTDSHAIACRGPRSHVCDTRYRPIRAVG